jgi:hypothetical protein
VVRAAALIAAAVLGGVPGAPQAEPAACWKALFMDWADGRISGAYPVSCYRTAIRRLSTDRLTYGPAAADLSRHLDVSLARLPANAAATPGMLIRPWPTRTVQASGAGSALTWRGALQTALAAVLVALLGVWVVARVRGTQ